MNSRSVSTRRILTIFFIIFTFCLQFLSTTQASAQQPLCGYLTWDTLGNYGYTILITCTTNERLFWFATSAPGLSPGNYYSIEDPVIQDLIPPLNLSGGTVSRQITGWSNYQIINSCAACPSDQAQPTFLIWRYPTDTLPPPPPPTSTPIPYPTLTPIPPPTSTPIPYPTLTPIPPPSSTYTLIPTISRATSTTQSISTPTPTIDKTSSKSKSGEVLGISNDPKLVSVGFYYPPKNLMDKILHITDTRNDSDYARDILSKFNFKSPELKNKSASSVIKEIENATIFYFVGHGRQQDGVSFVQFWDGENYSFLFGGKSGDKKFKYEESEVSAFYVGQINAPNLELVVVNGCETGKKIESPTNLLSSFQKIGVDVVIGFNYEIHPWDSELWGEEFWNNLENGFGAIVSAQMAADTVHKSIRFKNLKRTISRDTLEFLPKSGNDINIGQIISDQ